MHNKRKDGSDYWERVLISPLRDSLGNICNYISIREDISANKIFEQQHQHQATHDFLTVLVNRSLLKDRITQAVHQAQRNSRAAALLLLDLDGFKVINDTSATASGTNFSAKLHPD